MIFATKNRRYENADYLIYPIYSDTSTSYHEFPTIHNYCRLLSLLLRHFGFVCFGALRPKSTAKVMAGRSVHLTTLFPGQA